jgi:hypothetical protein
MAPTEQHVVATVLASAAVTATTVSPEIKVSLSQQVSFAVQSAIPVRRQCV